MLLDHEKDGTGSKRMARASAFLEAAALVDQSAQWGAKKVARLALTRAADSLRDKAVEERKAHDAQNKR